MLFEQHQYLLPDLDDIEIIDGIWRVQKYMPNYVLLRGDDFVADVWRGMYMSIGNIITKISLQNQDKFIVYRIKPMIIADPIPYDRSRLILNAEFTLSSTSKFVVHEIEYSVTTGSPVEWKCGHCGLPNKITATFCGEMHKSAAGCGAPRNFIR